MPMPGYTRIFKKYLINIFRLNGNINDKIELIQDEEKILKRFGSINIIPMKSYDSPEEAKAFMDGVKFTVDHFGGEIMNCTKNIEV